MNALRPPCQPSSCAPAAWFASAAVVATEPRRAGWTLWATVLALLLAAPSPVLAADSAASADGAPAETGPSGTSGEPAGVDEEAGGLGSGADASEADDAGGVAPDAVEIAAPPRHGDDGRVDLTSAAARWPTLLPALDAYRRRRYAAARAAAVPLMDSDDRELRVAAGWIAAQSATRLGDGAAAEQAWRQLERSGPLADRARIELARRAESRGDAGRAIALLAAVSAEHLEIDEVRLRRLALHLDRGELDDARRAADLLVPDRLPAGLRPQWELLHGDLERRSLHRGKAIAAYLRAARSGGDAVRDAALERLAALGAAPTPLQRVELLLNHPLLRDGRPRHGQTAKVRRARIRLVEAAAALSPGLLEYAQGVIASAARESRSEALTLLARAAAAAQDDDVAAMALYRRGDLLGKMERDAEAAVDLDAALQRARDAEVARTVRFRLARLLLYLGRGLDGERLLQEAVVKDAGTVHELLALWGLGWRRWQIGDLEEAARYLNRLSERAGNAIAGSTQPWRAKAGYWLARIDAARGDAAGANARYAEVAARWPQSYYGVIASDRLHERDTEAAAKIQGSPPPVGDEPTPRIQDVDLRPDARLAEIALLVRLGEREQARRLLRARLAHGLPAGAIQLLALLYAADGQHQAALAVLERYVRTASAPDASTLALWRGAFPTPFRDAFERAAHETGVPRALLYAIARTESSFVPTAQSGVGAVGLMQLLPPVAVRIAALWGLPAKAAKRLKTPSANVALGARYLKELSRLVHDNHALVAAGYNAGPYAVRRWLEPANGQPSDVLVEALPSAGARSYAMMVVATAASYAWLYPAWDELEALRNGRPLRTPSTPGPFLVGRPAQTPPATAATLQAIVGDGSEDDDDGRALEPASPESATRPAEARAAAAQTNAKAQRGRHQKAKPSVGRGGAKKRAALGGRKRGREPTARTRSGPSLRKSAPAGGKRARTAARTAEVQRRRARL